MRVGIIIYTPAQVHFYKNIIRQLRDDGNDVYVLARGYGETIDLLKELQIPYYPFTRSPTSKLGKALNLPSDAWRAYRYLKKNHVDTVTGYGIVNAFVSRMLGARDIVFCDSEPLSSPWSYAIQVRLFMLLTNALITPSAFRQGLGRKHVKVDSYKEMAYLHPAYYKPNEDIYRLLGVPASQDYVLLRFNAFDAVHDAGAWGFSPGDKVRLVHELEKYARVFISSEGAVPEEIRSHVLRVPKNRIHDVIYYARLLVTDTQTMATEGALLGTPTIRCNSFVGPKDMGNFIELESQFGLLYNFSDRNEAINKAVEMASAKDLEAVWQKKMSRFMADRIDINDFMVWFIENYPESFRTMKKDPGTQYKFKRSVKIESIIPS